MTPREKSMDDKWKKIAEDIFYSYQGFDDSENQIKETAQAIASAFEAGALSAVTFPSDEECVQASKSYDDSMAFLCGIAWLRNRLGAK
jgi:hypothetical protein